MVFPMDAKRGSDYRLTLSAAFRSYHKYSNIQRKENAWVLPLIKERSAGFNLSDIRITCLFRMILDEKRQDITDFDGLTGLFSSSEEERKRMPG